jgi:hypothetical protein
MISGEKHNDALYALNGVLIHARTLAFEQAPHQKLAKVLDIAELLPMLFLERRDATESFRGQLEALVEIDEGFTLALLRFDGEARFSTSL